MRLPSGLKASLAMIPHLSGPPPGRSGALTRYPKLRPSTTRDGDTASVGLKHRIEDLVVVLERLADRAPLATSQIRAVLSLDMVTMRSRRR